MESRLQHDRMGNAQLSVFHDVFGSRLIFPPQRVLRCLALTRIDVRF